SDEREDVQKKTFAKWINSQLIKSTQPPITDLFVDLQDGNRLLALLEVLTGKQYKREKGRMRVHHLNNVNKALQILEQNNVKLVNISNNDIVDGNPKLTLGLVWSIILHWQVHYHLKDLMSDLQQTNLEKTLLAWCRQNTKDYQGVDVKNFTTSWSDGLAFNALIHHWRPQLFDFNNIARKHPNARLEHAFRIAQEHLHIDRLLDPEDVNTSVPDKKSIMMYVMCLFQSLPHSEVDASTLESSINPETGSLMSPAAEALPFSAPPSRPISLATNVSVELGGYQVALEEVLTWLLEAEDKLSQSPVLAGDLETVKSQFHAHEEFLHELAGHQEGVRAVLEEGAHMVSEGGLSHDEEDEVRVQMRLLNSRWEDLRIKAMERQTRIHELLMSLQQQQLDQLRQWLTDTEDRISHMAEVANDPETLQEQIERHRELQNDLCAQQKVVDALSHMVVVVDDNSPESAYAQMEDQLTALGERWAHICQWTEDRWAQLQHQATVWGPVTKKLQFVQSALDTCETQLKTMEATPLEEMGQVMERVRTLQTIRVEMDDHQKKIIALQDLAQKLQAGSATDKILEKIEMLQDRWDALIQIMEVQGQRINSSGFEFSIKPIATENRSEVSSQDDEWSRSSNFTLQSSQEILQHASPKKRRLATVNRLEFDTKLALFQKWLDHIESRLDTCKEGSSSEGSTFNNYSLEEQIAIYEESQSDIEIHEEDYKQLVSLAKVMIRELQIQNEQTDAEEKIVNDLETRWHGVQQLLQHHRQTIDFMNDRKLFYNEVLSLELLLEGYEKWLESPKMSVSLAHQLEQCRAKLKTLKSNEERFTKLKKRSAELSANETAGPYAEDIDADADKVLQRWNSLLLRLTEKQTELTSAIDRTPPKKYLEAKEALMKWVHNVEGVLLSEHAVVSDITTMEDQLQKFRELQNTIDEQQDSFEYVNKTGQELIQHAGSEAQSQRLREELQDLNTRWSDIPAILEERQCRLTKDVETLRQFNDEMDGLNSWLQEVETFLQADDAIPIGELETLEAQLEQSNALQDDVETLQPNFNKIKTTAEKLLDNAEPAFAEQLKLQLEALSKKWEKVTGDSKQQNTALKEALEKTRKVISGVEDFKAWLCKLETEIPPSPLVNSSTELYQMKGRYQLLKDKVDSRTEDFRNLNEMGNDMMLSSEGSSVQELARRFTQLNAKWSEVTDHIYDRHRILKDASHEYGEFRALVAQEMDWLDKLEKRLRKSPKSAADAEEISEELDDLENYIRNHPEARLAKLQNIGRKLVEALVMPQSVQGDVEKITERWSLLSQKARDRTILLEGSVQEAQESESHILEFQEWVTQVDRLLTARVENDVTADDLPDDDQRLVEEFETQESTLKEMEEQVRTYHEAGKHEAAARLQEQMLLLQQRFAEVQKKFQRFRSPPHSHLEPRLSRALRELRGVEEATCLLELASDDPEGIEGQLKHCMRFYHKLSEIKAEVESIIKAGRKLVEEKAVSEPQKFSVRLDTLKELYNKLGLQITEAKTALDSALELSKSLHSNIPLLNEYIDNLERKLTDNEKHGNFNNKTYIQLIKRAVNDDFPVYIKVKDNIKTNFKAFSALCDPVYLEVLKDRINDTLSKWDKLYDRVTNIDKRHQEISIKDCETKLTDISKTADEINRWFLETEEKLNLHFSLPGDKMSEKQVLDYKELQKLLTVKKTKINDLHELADSLGTFPGTVIVNLKLDQLDSMWSRIMSKLDGWTQKVNNSNKNETANPGDNSLAAEPTSGDSRGREPQEMYHKIHEASPLVSVKGTEGQVVADEPAAFQELLVEPPTTNSDASSSPVVSDFSNKFEGTHFDVGVGYLNPAFEDTATLEESVKVNNHHYNAVPTNNKETVSAVDTGGPVMEEDVVNETAVKGLVVNKMVIPDVIQMTEPKIASGSTKTSTSELEDSVRDGSSNDDSDTFRLAKDSVLFSQVSNNTLISSSPDTNFSDISQHQAADPCQMVEVKAIEIVKHVMYPSRNVETSMHYGPQAVEMVEIVEDTEEEPEESAAETDNEDKGQTEDTTVTDTGVQENDKDGLFDTVISNKKLAKQETVQGSPKVQRKETDEEIIRVSPKNSMISVSNACTQPLDQLLTETAHSLNISPTPKLSIPGYEVEVHVTPTPPPTPLAVPTETPPELCLQITDRVNKTERTTVTAWREPECAEYLIIDTDNEQFVPELTNNKALPASQKDGKILEKNTSSALKEVILKKEIEVSKTYKITGSFCNPEISSAIDDIPKENVTLPLTTLEAEEYDSFYGSDKETDDVVEFSDDGVSPLELNNSSSSDDDESASFGHLISQHLDKAILSSRKEASVRKAEKLPPSSTTAVTVKSERSFPSQLKHSGTPPVAQALLSQSLVTEIAEFEDEAQHMLCRMDAMLETVRAVTNEKDPIKRLEVLEREFSLLAPDAATLISRGDGLVLTVHSSDPSRAEQLKESSQDKLRDKWHQVKSETEFQKSQAQQAEQKFKAFSKLVDELEVWLRDARRKIDLANNDEGQLQGVKAAFDKKHLEFSRLNDMSNELTKLNVGHGEGTVAKINDTWTDIQEKFCQLHKGSKEKEKVLPESKSSAAVQAADFVTHVNKVREVVSSVSRQLNSYPLNGKDYDTFPAQEETLKIVKEGLLSLKPRIDEIEQQRDAVMRHIRRDHSEQVRRVVDKLREEWSLVNRGYTERHSRWLKCTEIWRGMHNNCDTFSEWLCSAEAMISEWNTKTLTLQEAKSKLKELEKQITMKHRMMNNISSSCRIILSQSQPPESTIIQEKVERLRKRWQFVLSELTARRDKIAAMEVSNLPKSDPSSFITAASATLDQVRILLASSANPSDDTSLAVRLSMVKAREEELLGRKQEMEALNKSKQLPATDQVKSLSAALEKASYDMAAHREYVDCKLVTLKKYTSNVDSVLAWIMETKTRINISKELPEKEKRRVIDNILASVLSREGEVTEVLDNFSNLEEECETAKQPVSVELQEKIKKLIEDWQYVKCRGEVAVVDGVENAASVASTLSQVPRIRTTESSGAVSAGERPLRSVHVQTPTPTPAAAASASASASASAAPATSHHRSASAALVASFDKSILQIRDSLAVEEEMLRQQTVVVGDVEDILQVLDKQKNVLRELEQKKPQLDELVHTAENLKADSNRQQLHGKALCDSLCSPILYHLRTYLKVTKLREHWDETNAKVMQRKSQLDAMLSDSQRYEGKRLEVEAWLTRMETRLERMAAVGHTADVLEAQLREQKSYHAELHQYKHHIEIFNQLTQKLIAVYQQDDTSRVKKMTEAVNQRYGNLNSSIINRGKLLHSAMSSLHNFDRSLDKFLAWLSEAESSMECVESDADRLGSRRDAGAIRQPLHQLKSKEDCNLEQLRKNPISVVPYTVPVLRNYWYSS
ncbi:dystrophin, isoforms A/C/F/G/H-like, partial [Schistocerca cancellata]|uniref:dystrophin, isoforms A/C/F/G/H-like n=1 Tax=Schistocerca cancellata TaxID=274614 RepID=UPI002119B1B1